MELSVIIPCCDEAATITQQLDALAGQVWDGEWEIVLVDNGSTDDSVALATKHSGVASRLRIVNAPDARGVAAVRRRGVEASTARSVVFCDGDDIVGPAWVSAFGDALRTHDFVTGHVEVDRLNTPGLAASRGRRRIGLAPMYGGHTILSGGNGGMTRVAWDRHGGFNDEFNGLEDIELSLRIAAAGEHVEFVPGAMLHYRYRSGARALWKQGRFYGASQIMLARRCRSLGFAAPRSHAWKSWVWLALRLPIAWLPGQRLAWLWVLACRVGALRAHVRYRARRVGFLGLLVWARRPIRSLRPTPSSPTAPRGPLHLVTIAFDNPALVEAQMRMLRDCLVDRHTVSVADNSRSAANADAIRDLCRATGVEYFRLHPNPYTGRDPSRSHAEALRAAVRHLGRHDGLESVDVLGLLDHDVFPTTGTSVLGRMGACDAYGTRKPGNDCWYLWPGLLFLRRRPNGPHRWSLRSLDFRPVAGRGDTGCAFAFDHFRHMTDERIVLTQRHDDTLTIEGRTIVLEWHDTWIHTENGSNWRGERPKNDEVLTALRRHGLVDR